MMPRAYHEDRHRPWDAASFIAELERALEPPSAPLEPTTLHPCLAALPNPSQTPQPQPGPLLCESKPSSPHGDLELASALPRSTGPSKRIQSWEATAGGGPWVSGNQSPPLSSSTHPIWDGSAVGSWWPRDRAGGEGRTCASLFERLECWGRGLAQRVLELSQFPWAHPCHRKLALLARRSQSRPAPSRSGQRSPSTK